MPLRFRLATQDDDAALRRAFASTPMEGGMRLAFEREPSFHDALVVQGPFVQVIICEDTATGAIAAFGTRAIADAFVNGTPRPLGYLSDLRILPAYRNRTILARGYQFLRELDRDNRTALYSTAIFSENAAARGVLLGGRAGLPEYQHLGGLVTLGIHTSGLSRAVPPRLRIARGEPGQLGEMVSYLNSYNAGRQLAPVHHLEDFAPTGRWRNLDASDFFLAWEGSILHGVAALWDQSPFKQTRVLSYSGRWWWLRWLSRILSTALPVARLPSPGSLFRFGYASFIALDTGKPEILYALLRTMREEAARRKWMHLLLTLHERDPLLAIASQLPHTKFHGDLYQVAMQSPAALNSGFLPHVEASLL